MLLIVPILGKGRSQRKGRASARRKSRIPSIRSQKHSYPQGWMSLGRPDELAQLTVTQWHKASKPRSLLRKVRSLLSSLDIG